MVGDFNATPIWPVYRAMAAVLEDLALTHARATGRRPRRTWPSWPEPLGWFRFLRIDHCFGHGLEVHHCEVVDLPGSDHKGLLLDLAAK